MTEEDRAALLRDYSAGRLDTRSTIERLGLRDFAGLIIARSALDLPLPKPDETEEPRRNCERARAILMPRLLASRPGVDPDPSLPSPPVA